MQPSPRAHSAAIQHALEEHALELAERPEIRVARQAGDQALRAAFPDADARSLERLPAIAEEIKLNALIGLESRIVSLADLSDALPPWLRRVDATERAEIQVRRERDHALRFEEFIYD